MCGLYIGAVHVLTSGYLLPELARAMVMFEAAGTPKPPAAGGTCWGERQQPPSNEEPAKSGESRESEAGGDLPQMWSRAGKINR